MNTEYKKQNTRNNLARAIHEYCSVFFDETDEQYNERLIAGVMAFLQANHYRECYMFVSGVDEVIQEKKLWQFWKRGES